MNGRFNQMRDRRLARELRRRPERSRKWMENRSTFHSVMNRATTDHCKRTAAPATAGVLMNMAARSPEQTLHLINRLQTAHDTAVFLQDISSSPRFLLILTRLFTTQRWDQLALFLINQNQNQFQLERLSPSAENLSTILSISAACTRSGSTLHNVNFLADRTNGRAIGTVLRPSSSSSSSVCLSVTLCIVAKWSVLEQKLLLRAYRKSYI